MESAEYLYQAAPLTIPGDGRRWFQTFPCWAPGYQAGCRRGAGGEMSINQLENGLWSHNMMAFPQVPSIQDAVMLSDLHSCLTLNLCKYLCTVSLPAIKSSISLTVLGTWLNSSAPYSVTMNSSSILIGQLYSLYQPITTHLTPPKPRNSLILSGTRYLARVSFFKARSIAKSTK